MSKKTKIFAIIILAIAVLIGVASLADKSPSKSASNSADNPLTSSQAPAGVTMPVGTASSSPAVRNDFSVLLSTVKSITIDTTIFDDPVYKTLRDHPIDLGTEDVGRPNPFAPVGVDIGTITGTAAVVGQPTVDIQTLQPNKVTPTTAEFGARVMLPEGSNGMLTFEYGPSDVFGSVTSPIAVTKTDNYLFAVTGLVPSTSYSVRAVLVRGSTTSLKGTTMLFTTTAKTGR